MPEWNNAPSKLHAETIEEVIASLDRVVEWAEGNNQRAGYFAALYRKVTIKVKEGIEAGVFDDGARMEKLDVIFANRYLDAFEDYSGDKPVSHVWKLALDLTEDWFPLVLTQLMIGMNAHINFDLGIAAAQTVDEEQMEALQPDFNKINKVLSDLVDEVENELAEFWPLFKWLDRVAGSLDERLADCGMAFARDRAWDFALEYAAATNKPAVAASMDEKMTHIGKLFLSPGLIKNAFLFIIRLGERGSVARKISILS